MKTKFTILIAVGLLFAATPPPRPRTLTGMTRRNIRHDRVDVRHDRYNLARDRRDDQFYAAQRDRRDLRSDRRDLRFDRRDSYRDRLTGLQPGSVRPATRPQELLKKIASSQKEDRFPATLHIGHQQQKGRPRKRGRPYSYDRVDYFFSTFAIVAPISAGVCTTVIPHSAIIFILAAAVSSAPPIMAPA